MSHIRDVARNSAAVLHCHDGLVVGYLFGAADTSLENTAESTIYGR